MEELLERLAPPATPDGLIHKTNAMDGVRIWNFDLHFPSEWDHLSLPPEQLEALFCQSGRMSIQWKDGGRLHLRAGEILLLSDLSQVQTFCWPDRRMGGILICADTIRAGKSLRQLCALLGGLDISPTEAGRLVQQQRGCGILAHTPWSIGVFHLLQGATSEQQNQCCMVTFLELLYLLCSHHPGLSWKALDIYYDHHQIERVRQVHAYLLEHSAETLTIQQLASQFQISSTVLKQCFRHLYGQPIRKYLQGLRMRRAAELLRTTQKSILQIANAVGYESTSQFGLLFQRHYQMLPSEYRIKMSDSDDSCLNPFAPESDPEYNEEIQSICPY